ncbi:glycan-binding surface protein [Lewinella sp. IMCC34191]|uniref:glycan-binding surface protein n=1 Tax=Lewinella sp. IMCC34191 TaxID=2259172 RepID=UPI0013003934|nr:glycan-binding surface protein [Lewinella sp. IMCC34191]
MKFLPNRTLILATALLLVAVFLGCEKDDLIDGGRPSIEYVRVTTPEASDSLVVSAFQGSLVAIIGNNLGGTVEVWFNDLMADLNPVYVTDQSILVSVPSDVPTEVTNQIRLQFADGGSLSYAFEVDISEPEINSMKSEYVFDGDVATIYGNYFYEPITVTFTGGLEGEVLPATTEDGQILRVVVPEGAEAGPISVSTNFGTTESDFWFRDDRNIILSSDPFTGWWNIDYVVEPSEVGPGDPASINGNYIRVNKMIGAWEWTEVAGGAADAVGEVARNFPDEAIQDPQDYFLKFEVNTVKPYNNNIVRFNFGLPSEVNEAYFWQPPYDSQGEWETVAIPLEQVFSAYSNEGVTPVVIDEGYWTRILIFGGNALDADISFDNFRIVPKTLD